MVARDNKFEEMILAWLEGRSSDIPGRRLLAATFNDVTYLGTQKGPELHRYHVENGLITESPNCAPTPAEDAFVHACDAARVELCARGRLVETWGPLSYEAGMAFYTLAP